MHYKHFYLVSNAIGIFQTKSMQKLRNYALFYRQHSYKQHQTEIGKILSKSQLTLWGLLTFNWKKISKGM